MMVEFPETSPPAAPRIFLVVVDETEEMAVALRYAAQRARRTGGRVALLRAVEPDSFQHWASLEQLIRQERLEEAQQALHRLGDQVMTLAGTPAILYLREGDTREELLKLIAEEPTISILVLAAGTGSGGPGPLVADLVGRLSGSLRIPTTVVPGGLSDTEIDLIT